VLLGVIGTERGLRKTTAAGWVVCDKMTSARVFKRDYKKKLEEKITGVGGNRRQRL